MSKKVNAMRPSCPTNATSSKVRAEYDKVIDNEINMSEPHFEHYQFTVYLNQEHQFGFTVHQMVSLAYEGAPSPWPAIRRCRCMSKLEPGSKVTSRSSKPSVQASCPNCQTNSPLAGKSKAIASSEPENSICPKCDGVQCSHSKHPRTLYEQKQDSQSILSDPPDTIGCAATFSMSPLHSSQKIQNCSEYNNVCKTVDDSSRNQRKVTSITAHRSRRLNSVASISCTCYQSRTSGKSTLSSSIRTMPNKISSIQELECTHQRFLHYDSPVDAMSNGSIEKDGKSKMSAKACTPTTQPSRVAAPQKGSCVSTTPENGHANCCRVIHLSEREHLLLRRFDEAKGWCQKLNEVSEQLGMRTFLLRRSWEVHVRAICTNFDHTRIQVLKATRDATLWWDSEHRKGHSRTQFSLSEADLVRSNGSVTLHEHEKQVHRHKGGHVDGQVGAAMDPSNTESSIPVTTLAAPSAETSIPFYQGNGLTKIRDSYVDEPIEQPEFKCELFPDCQLTANSPEQPCLRIYLPDKEHETFLQYDDTGRIIHKLNGALSKKGLSVFLLKLKPELHISACGEDQDKLLRILWGAAVDTDLQHKLIPLFKSMRSTRSEKVLNANAVKANNDKNTVVTSNAPEDSSVIQGTSETAEDHRSSTSSETTNRDNDSSRSTPHAASVFCACSRYQDCSTDDRKICYRIPFATTSEFFDVLIQLGKENLMEKINSELAQHDFAIGLVCGNTELHMRCLEGEFSHACCKLWLATRLYNVGQYLHASFETLKNSLSFEDFKVVPPPSPSCSSTESSRRGTMCSFKPSGACEDYPECLNSLSPGDSECCTIPIDLNDGTHSALLAWNRTDEFVRKLNLHLLDLDAGISLLRSRPEFHVIGKDSHVLVPVLHEIITGIKAGGDMKGLLLFLYPEHARNIGKGWRKGMKGPCKCHGTIKQRVFNR